MDRSEYDSVHEGCYDIEEKLKARVKRVEDILREALLWNGEDYRRSWFQNAETALAEGDTDAKM